MAPNPSPIYFNFSLFKIMDLKQPYQPDLPDLHSDIFWETNSWHWGNNICVLISELDTEICLRLSLLLIHNDLRKVNIESDACYKHRCQII